MFKISYPVNLPFAISQKWGENKAFYATVGSPGGHNGWDFAVPIGTPVYATHDGVVQFSQVDSVMSLTVSIDTNDGNYRTMNCHLSETRVTVGQPVQRGQLIGLSGNTGRYTTGPHLHFGVHKLKPETPDNGFNGATDPAMFFDGLYPSSVETFLAMQTAILKFQVENGVMDFVGKPITSVNFGPNTKLATLKFKS